MLVAATLLSAAIFGMADACTATAKGPAALVTVHGFRDRSGNLRIAIYPANDEDFLAGGRYVQRIDVPLTPEGDMTVCAPVPGPGRYAVVALHDRNANGKMDAFRDGVGMSRNPKLGLSKPDVEKAEITIDRVQPMSIELNYLQGLSVRPWRPRQNR